MKMPSRSRPSVRRALTLVELVVVMVILAAVAGIILPLLPNMITRAHTSTGATNVGELAKALQTHEAIYLSSPNNFDSLVTTPAGTIATYVPGNTGFDLTTIPVPTQETIDSLNAAGIKTVAQMVVATTGDFNPTFYPYGNSTATLPTVTTIGTTTPLAAITGAAALRKFSLPVDGTYVVFGAGSRTTMQGKTLQEAPVHFSDEGTSAPNLAYSRFGIVYQTATAGGSPLDRARLIGIVAFHPDGIVTLNDHLAEFWNSNKN
ncbi:MAG: type II secretion system GspH family protein [Planctomycetia bacterium]|nr:type II secretion system GspH family protein [Planctomycetia bacterium]